MSKLTEVIWYELGDGLNATDVNEAVQSIKRLMLDLVGNEREWDTNEPYDNPDMAQGYNEAICAIKEKIKEL